MKNILKIQELERQIRKLKATAGNSPENAKCPVQKLLQTGHLLMKSLPRQG